MDHHARAVISGMFLGLPGRDGDGVFGDLGSESVVGSKCFLSWSVDILQDRCRGKETLQFWQ